MTSELIDEAIASAIILFGLLGVLGIGGLIADYVFPRIGPLNRWLDTVDTSDALDSLGLTREDLEKNPALKEALEKAAADIRKEEGFEW